jgi:hypothetical protein
MSKKFKKLIETFNASIQEACEKCGPETEKLRVLIVKSASILRKFILFSKPGLSLVDMRIAELYRLSYYILYLSLSGLYRNAFDNIRYILESFIQSIYIDSRHPKSSMRTRIEILKEIEDKREYHAVRLINELKIDHKKTLSSEYKKLSQIIHPSHRNIVQILQDFQLGAVIAPVNCAEISNIHQSLEMVFDIILFLRISYAPENLKESLKKDSDLIKHCKTYKLPLLSRILRYKVR